MTQVPGSLPPSWGTQIELCAPNFDLAHLSVSPQLPFS